MAARDRKQMLDGKELQYAIIYIGYLLIVYLNYIQQSNLVCTVI